MLLVPQSWFPQKIGNKSWLSDNMAAILLYDIDSVSAIGSIVLPFNERNKTYFSKHIRGINYRATWALRHLPLIVSLTPETKFLPRGGLSRTRCLTRHTSLSSCMELASSILVLTYMSSISVFSKVLIGCPRFGSTVI